MTSFGSQHRHKVSFTSFLAVAVVALAGCSGNTAAVPQPPPFSPGGPGASTSSMSSMSSIESVDVRSRKKIFIVGESSNTLTTYTLLGTPTKPTIAGLDAPVGLAVDARGKIYVANSAGTASGRGSIATYDADGSPARPTITAAIDTPWGIAVDQRGKIYVANYNAGTVTTYAADGTRTTPTISGLNQPTAVAVDRHGKIYVTQKGSGNSTGLLTTFAADGRPATPTITAGIDIPQAVAVDSYGTIYVSNDASDAVTTYDSKGNQRSVTLGGFTTGDPGYLAIGGSGDVYVTSSHGYMTTYTKTGAPTEPTISGLGPAPLGIALH